MKSIELESTVADKQEEPSQETDWDMGYWWWMGWGIAHFVHLCETGEPDPRIRARWARATLRRFGVAG